MFKTSDSNCHKPVIWSAYIGMASLSIFMTPRTIRSLTSDPMRLVGKQLLVVENSSRDDGQVSDSVSSFIRPTDINVKLQLASIPSPAMQHSN